MTCSSRREFLVRSAQGAGSAAVASLIPRILAANQNQTKGPQPYPIAVTVGNKGTIFVADHELKTIYKVGDAGDLTVVYKGSRRYRTPWLSFGFSRSRSR